MRCILFAGLFSLTTFAQDETLFYFRNNYLMQSVNTDMKGMKVAPSFIPNSRTLLLYGPYKRAESTQKPNTYQFSDFDLDFNPIWNLLESHGMEFIAIRDYTDFMSQSEGDVSIYLQKNKIQCVISVTFMMSYVGSYHYLKFLITGLDVEDSNINRTILSYPNVINSGKTTTLRLSSRTPKTLLFGVKKFLKKTGIYKLSRD